MKARICKIFFPIIFFGFSCSLNRAFLHPDKGQLKRTAIRSDVPDKRFFLVFDPLTFKPMIISEQSDTLGFDVDINSFVFQKEDNTRLNGWLLKPDGDSAGTTLIFFHGNAGSLFSQFGLISPLVKEGYQVFMFDYSGFGFSEGRATRRNTLSDAQAAVQYALRLPEVKGTRVFFYGQSYGGHLAASIAHLYEQEIQGLVIEGAFTSPKAIAARKAGPIGRILAKTIFSGIDSIGYFRKPVLIIHSKNDRTVPFSMGKKYYDRAGDPKELYGIENPHCLGPAVYSKEIAKKIGRIAGGR
jgi:uncharacterized protein